jgi:hypothetical protein
LVLTRYICNSRGEHIASFYLEDLDKCYHLEKGTKNIEKELLGKFRNTTKDLYHIWSNPNKKFKIRPTNGYPTNALRNFYQYMVSMLCRLYGEKYAFNFSLSYMPLVYHCAERGSSFNKEEIILENPEKSITTVVEAHPRAFPIFHISSYLIDIMYVAHQYPNMG